MLKIDGLKKKYGQSMALDGLSMQVDDGSLYGFVGPNGAGKTTTIKIITGLLLPDRGTVTIDGIDVTREPASVREKIGYVPDFFGIYDNVKVSEYMEIKDRDRDVVLCHYPIPCFKNHFYGWYHLYGHVHNSFESKMMEHDKFLMEQLYDRKCQMFNVGAMMPWMDYTPRTLDEIIASVKEVGMDETSQA